MAPPVVININFENKTGYFPGETVKGQVEVIFKKNLPVKAISLNAAGISEVKFDNFNLFDGGFKIVSEEEEYYTKFVSLFRKGSSSHKFSKGTYSYDFSFDLPTEVPSSFESKYGFVKHVCTAIVSPDDQTGINIDHRVLFNVFASYDLNHEQSAKPKIQYTGEEILCCTKGFLSLILDIDRSGFIPGEKILINAECTNASNKPTVSKAKLQQIITYKANGKTKTERKLICSKAHPPTDPGSDDTWSGEPMLIPRLVPSEMRGCTLIDIEYKFKFQIRQITFPFTLKMSSPIVIGTVSLDKGLSSGEHQQPPPSAPSAPFCPGSSPYSPSAPPPLYGEVNPNPNRTINISLTANEGRPAPGNLSVQYEF